MQQWNVWSGGWDILHPRGYRNSDPSLDVQKQTPQLTESYKASMFITAPGARGIVHPNLHTESQNMHLFITKFI